MAYNVTNEGSPDSTVVHATKRFRKFSTINLAWPRGKRSEKVMEVVKNLVVHPSNLPNMQIFREPNTFLVPFQSLPIIRVATKENIPGGSRLTNSLRAASFRERSHVMELDPSDQIQAKFEGLTQNLKAPISISKGSRLKSSSHHVSRGSISLKSSNHIQPRISKMESSLSIFNKSRLALGDGDLSTLPCLRFSRACV